MGISLSNMVYHLVHLAHLMHSEGFFHNVSGFLLSAKIWDICVDH